MGDEEEDACNTELGLGLGLSLSLGLGMGVDVGGLMPKCNSTKKEEVVCLDLSIPLHPKEEGLDHDEGNCYIRREEGSCSKTIFEEYKFGLTSNKWNPIHDDDQNNNNCSRKKLRLTKLQSTLLEESFKLHTTLNQIQKQTLAAKLNLRTRQVEVWFQNRRARTKSKRSEVECELLKKWCESLSNENRRLQKELRELRLLNLDQPHDQPPLCINDQLPMAATLTICPSCSQKHQ